jgi:hypothetical protein
VLTWVHGGEAGQEGRPGCPGVQAGAGVLGLLLSVF